MTFLCAEIVAGVSQLADPIFNIGLARIAPIAAVRVDLDRTVVLAFVLFIALVVVLKPLLFDPVLRVFELREQRTDGVKAEAREMQERAGELLRKYERELEQVNRVASEERERVRQETTKLEGQILAEARSAAQAIVEAGRQDIEREVGTVRQALTDTTGSLARDIVSGVLGRSLDGRSGGLR